MADPSGPAWLARPTNTNLHALDGCPPRSVGTGARFNAHEIASTLTGHRLAEARNDRPGRRALAQFVCHSPPSGAVHGWTGVACCGWSGSVSPSEIEEDARRLLAQARGYPLALARKQLGLGQKQIAAAMGVSVARVSQIEHGEVTSFEVIARYVEALGGRLDLVADFGDRTIRLPVSDTATAA